MATRIATATRDAAIDAITALLDGGDIEVRTGAQPASPNTAATGTLLGTLALGDPAFGASANGSATANAITDDGDADDSGVAGWFRASGPGGAVIDGSITGPGGGGDLELDDTDIVAGGVISVTSWTVTMPGA